MIKHKRHTIQELPSDMLMIGWQEWCSLPELNIPAIKAKIDTGAKTSALHAFDIQSFHRHDKLHVKFQLHPLQNNLDLTINCHAPVIDMRDIMSSNGHKEERYVIQTHLTLGGLTWPIELTLSNRDPLRFRMLLGREALKNRVMIEPHRTMCQQYLRRKEVDRLYNKHTIIQQTSS